MVLAQEETDKQGKKLKSLQKKWLNLKLVPIWLTQYPNKLDVGYHEIKGEQLASLFYWQKTLIMQKELISYLSNLITPERLNLFEKILEQRTSYLTIVLEDIFQPQNASAVLRTCDCFGIQHIHIIENRNEFTVDREVAMGASKWLSLHKYNQEKNNSLNAIRVLKEKGYRIVATSPHLNDSLLPEFDLSKGKAAIVFGSELPGISDAILNEADEFLKIPMYGFTESFNISVSAAIVMYQLAQKLRELPEIDWKLSEQEKDDIKLAWLHATIKRSSMLEKRFLKEWKQKEQKSES